MMIQRALQFHRAGQIDAAITAYREVLSVCPDSAPALTNLGSLLRQQGLYEDALALLQRAVEVPGSNEHAAYNLGNVYRAQGRWAEACSAFAEALRRRPDWPLALCNLGVTLADLGEADKAVSTLQRALVLEPAFDLARENLRRICSHRLISAQYRAEDEVTLFQWAKEYGALFPSVDAMPHADCTGRPLRIGFVSPDLCDHPVGFFLLPLLEHLDRSACTPLLFSSGGREDITRRKLAALAEWQDIAGLDDERVFLQLRSANLDVAIDLSGHTKGHCLPVFARRVAPIQVSWLGYFATTGITAMDYILMDTWHAPPDEDARFVERVMRFSASRFCYFPAAFAPLPAPPPLLAAGNVTFGCFNNPAKFHDGVYSLWAAVLRAVPDSRLLLKWWGLGTPAGARPILSAFAQYGLGAERLVFRDASCHADLLAEYAEVDIALDPFPFTGGHTSCEALWMGVPVLTMPGSRPVSRQTLCFIANLGREDWLAAWVATDASDYVNKAVALASSPADLQDIRQSLRSVMAASPLMNAPAFAHDFLRLIYLMTELSVPIRE